MLVIIVVSSVQIALDNPLNDPKGLLSKIIGYVDLSLTGIFAMEALIKIIAFGYIACGSTSYIRNPWNILDFFVVVVTIVSNSMNNTANISVIKIMRLMKILRPLRVISRNEGLKISIRTLGRAVPGIFNVIIVSSIFYLIFGIIGINYMKGR